MGHGKAKDDFMESGLQRGIGHGRRYIGTTDHMHGGAAGDDPPGAHGHSKDDAMEGGMPRGMGHGKHHISVVDHMENGSSKSDAPGTHGHSKDDDFEGGLQRGVGHGRRHFGSGLDALMGGAVKETSPRHTPGLGSPMSESPSDPA